MKKLKVLLIVVGVIQMILGLAYLVAPAAVLASMGHSAIARDIAYPLGMLSARFIVYGILLMVASRDPARHKLLITGMVGIQLIDLAVGLFYTFGGAVPLGVSAFPMFNALWIATLLWLWRPSTSHSE